MPKKIFKFIFPAILITISLFLCLKNYTPNTYLIGWDSLHPEFNFPEAFRRVWEGVWRAEQGVGAVAAHGDVADLPRMILLWIFSFVLPASFLRYSYIFLCLIFGPLGIYFFLKYVFQRESNSAWVYPSAFLGGLFYLLNLGTIQNFYVPLEMFPTAFALLPWLFFSGLKYLREGTRKNLIFFSITVILASPMAYAATLWYASFAGLFIFLTTFAFISSAKKIKIKRVFILGIFALFLNLYWILPNIYSLINQSLTIKNANINLLFSPEAFLRNRDYGDVKDVLIQKNFLFSWRNFDFQKMEFTNLLGTWIKHLANPFVLKTGYILSGLFVLGLGISIIKKEKVALSLIPVLIFTLFFLFNINPPLGNIYAYFYNNSDLFSEGFRMPFTKFSILYELITSFYFGYFAFLLLTLKEAPLKVFIVLIKALFFVSITAGLIYFMLPAFNGWLIGTNVRKNLPSEYQQMFSWFNSNPYGRIALMPINSKYGWEYRNWGYEGSGFITYGIKDPILYRDFDRWSVGNEDFYTQALFALYSNGGSGFVDTLKKYQVKYILLDESIINSGGTADILKIPEFKQVAKFGFLTIYETGFGGAEVSAPSKFVRTDSDFSYSPVDPIYAKNGDYISSNNTIPARLVPSLPSGSPAISENLSINRGFPNAYNCDLEKVGSVFKNNSKEGILYRAENGGVSCDYLNFPSLLYSQAYVLRIAGENKEGRSLKIYFINEFSKATDLEEILPTGNFDKSYLVLPTESSPSAGVGYTLSVETRSFGRIPSENILSKVEFYPVDSSYLQTFKGLPLQGVQNNLKIQNVKKYGTWAYKIDTEGSGLIELGQGYEQGWLALQIPNIKFQIDCITSCANLKQELKHVKVNSWANGWMVPASIESPVSSIYIIFWPQLLEWGGMGLIGIVLTLL